jgi:hypothetical protein
MQYSNTVYFIFCTLHSLDNCEIIFRGKTMFVHKILLTKKNYLETRQRINSSSCMHWFKKLEILNITCFYIYCLMLFVVDNLHYFQTNFSVHEINTRHNNQSHVTPVTLSAIHRYCLLCC